MRVSKVVREYIEKEVGVKAEIKRQAVHDMVKLSARFLANICES